MSSGSNRPWAGRAGVTSLELALVFIPFLMMMIGVTDVARYLLTDSSILTLMHAAERKTMINQLLTIQGLKRNGQCSEPTTAQELNDPSIEIAAIAPFLDPEKTYLCVEQGTAPAAVPQIQILISYPFSPVFPGLSLFFPPMITEMETFTY